MSYLTIDRKAAVIDPKTNHEFTLGFENVTAGGYSPAMEALFCPSVQPTTREKRENQSDELTQDEADEAELGQADDATVVIASSGNAELDVAIAKHEANRPAFLKRMAVREAGRRSKD